MIQQNSLFAYYDLKEDKILGKRCKEVFELINIYPDSCDRELADLVGKEPNYIRPRRNELMKMGLIEKSGNKIYFGSLKKNSTWRVSKNASRT